MAINTQSIKTAPNAFEYSNLETVALADGEKATDYLPSTTNSTGLTMGFKRKDLPSDVLYKVQLSYSTVNELATGVAEWHDWDIDGLDVDGFLDEDSFERWIPIPSAMRVVLKSATSGSLYWAVRGQ